MVLTAIIIWHSPSLCLRCLHVMFFSPSPLKFTSSYLSWITKHLFLSPCSHPVSPPSPTHFFLVIPQWMTHGLLPPCPRRTLSSSRAWALESGYCCGGDGRKTPVRRVSCIPGAYPSQWFKRLYNTPLFPSSLTSLQPHWPPCCSSCQVSFFLGNFAFLSAYNTLSPDPCIAYSLTYFCYIFLFKNYPVFCHVMYPLLYFSSDHLSPLEI